MAFIKENLKSKDKFNFLMQKYKKKEKKKEF